MSDGRIVRRPLKGLALGISISESEETEGLGLTTREVNRTVQRLSLAVLGQGGRVVFGHDWRADGVMETVLTMAIGYQRPRDPDDAGPAMTNLVPWPARSFLPDLDRKHYEGILRIVEFDEPAVPRGGAGRHIERDGPVMRVLALTEMRRELNRHCDARLCIGGRTTGSSGFGSGVFEEAALAVEDGLPLYLTGLFGGASAQAIRALQGERLTAPVLEPKPEVAAALRDSGLPSDAGAYEETLRGAGIDALARANRLSIDENRRLFEARSLSEVIGLVLTGLSRLQAG